MYFVACTKCKNVHQMWVHSTECKQKWPFSDNFSIKFHPETVKEHEKIKAWNNILFPYSLQCIELHIARILVIYKRTYLKVRISERMCCEDSKSWLVWQNYSINLKSMLFFLEKTFLWIIWDCHFWGYWGGPK